MHLRSRLFTLLAIAVVAFIAVGSLLASASPALAPVPHESAILTDTAISLPVVARHMPGVPELSDRAKLVAMGGLLFGLAAVVKRSI